jgi:hypothetical protein
LLDFKKLRTEGLLLDNAPCHPNIEISDGIIRCMFLPANTTSLIQPMHQCVISALKIGYRGRILRERFMVIESNVEFVIEKYAHAYTKINRQCINFMG